jgi:hypothetical protein
VRSDDGYLLDLIIPDALRRSSGRSYTRKSAISRPSANPENDR